MVIFDNWRCLHAIHNLIRADYEQVIHNQTEQALISLSVCLQLRSGFIWHVLKTHMNETNYNASSQFPCQQGWFLYGFCKAFYAAVLYPGSQMNDLSCLVFYLKCNGITNLNQKNNSQINNLKLHKSHLQFPIKGSHVNPKTCQVPILGINGFKWIILLVSKTKTSWDLNEPPWAVCVPCEIVLARNICHSTGYATNRIKKRK